MGASPEGGPPHGAAWETLMVRSSPLPLRWWLWRGAAALCVVWDVWVGQRGARGWLPEAYMPAPPAPTAAVAAAATCCRLGWEVPAVKLRLELKLP